MNYFEVVLFVMAIWCTIGLIFGRLWAYKIERKPEGWSLLNILVFALMGLITMIIFLGTWLGQAKIWEYLKNARVWRDKTDVE